MELCKVAFCLPYTQLQEVAVGCYISGGDKSALACLRQVACCACRSPRNLTVCHTAKSEQLQSASVTAPVRRHSRRLDVP
jgi:hypothetical protein